MAGTLETKTQLVEELKDQVRPKDNLQFRVIHKVLCIFLGEYIRRKISQNT